MKTSQRHWERSKTLLAEELTVKPKAEVEQ